MDKKLIIKILQNMRKEMYEEGSPTSSFICEYLTNLTYKIQMCDKLSWSERKLYCIILFKIQKYRIKNLLYLTKKRFSDIILYVRRRKYYERAK